ncbi:MAG: hypothetical protein CVU42_01865 [Chloroflexi bacterium HGW-Chloroflexi-4]|nr:MAG: hypothetical protein CVU42_01865 [Chloroflexi bacterium HGW-Chloroflexi-4]
MNQFSKVLKTIMGGSNTKPSLDSMLASFDRELDNFQTLVKPDSRSRPRTAFDSPHLTFDDMYMSKLTLRQILSFLPVMLPLRMRMIQSARMYDGKFQPEHSSASPEFLTALEKMAFSAGVADIRYVRVPRNTIFAHKGIPYEYAVIFTVEMDKNRFSKAPSFDAFLEVARGYGNLARIGNKLARFMRHNGFAAYPGTALGGITDYSQLGEIAGLGAIGYHGLLITPNQGAHLRINTIYTNITNLPIQTENKHIWVREFCSMCKKCIRGCPVQAIFEQPRVNEDGGIQCIEHGACRDYFNQNYGCAVCLANCPFSEMGYEKVKVRFKGNPKAPQFHI